jgi:polygalacturonase
MKKEYFIRISLVFVLVATIGANEINGIPPAVPANVKEFGARGDGKTDDTDAIISAVKKCGDGILEFPRGSYRITRTIDIMLSETGTMGLYGKGGSARIIMEGEGPAFRFTGSHNGTAGPESVKTNIWDKERMPLVDALEIVGTNPKSDGLEFRHTLMPVLRGLLIRNVHHGIHLASRNRNVIIDGCHVYDCSGVGIYLDSVNLHQIIISDSHISYCKLGGIRISRSEIRDIQITGNDIEYNCDPEGPVSADIWFDCSKRGSIREGTISGNTIQAIPSPGGANIRFTGPSGNYEQIGLLSITGNHISNQTVNIDLKHTRGISITGNTFIRGYDRSMIIEDSHNLIISENVMDHNKDYFPEKMICHDGISIIKSKNMIISNNIIDGVEYGSMESGGAVNISDCLGITLSGCQILNPKFRAIQIENSKNVRVNECLIKEDDNKKRMLWSIELKGACQGSIIKNNSLGKGKKGDIMNNANGVVIEGNSTVEN